jgi:hypothetical protein
MISELARGVCVVSAQPSSVLRCLQEPSSDTDHVPDRRLVESPLSDEKRDASSGEVAEVDDHCLAVVGSHIGSQVASVVVVGELGDSIAGRKTPVEGARTWRFPAPVTPFMDSMA